MLKLQRAILLIVGQRGTRKEVTLGTPREVLQASYGVRMNYGRFGRRKSVLQTATGDADRRKRRCYERYDFSSGLAQNSARIGHARSREATSRPVADNASGLGNRRAYRGRWFRSTWTCIRTTVYARCSSARRGSCTRFALHRSEAIAFTTVAAQ